MVWALPRHQSLPAVGAVTVMLWPNKATFMVIAAMAAISSIFFIFNNLLVVVHGVNTNISIISQSFQKK
jgi:hypothetical protein